MGHMILWGLKKPIMPWCTDGLGEAEIGGSMETSLAHWADEAHEQGGWVVNPHFPSPNGEPAALVAMGRLDAVEMIRQNPFNHSEYYRYLNCGYRLPLVGGTDKMSSDVPVGMYRTYTRIPDEEFSYESWCNNVARGRTFLSSGPIISLKVDGREIGDTVKISGPGTVEVEVTAESIFPIHTLELVRAGRVVATANSSAGARRLEIRERIRVDGHTWLAARCGGPGYYGFAHHDVWSRGVFAHTSPVYVACGERLVDVRQGGRPVHADAGRGRSGVHKAYVGAAQARDGHPPPRRRRPHGFLEPALPAGPGRHTPPRPRAGHEHRIGGSNMLDPEDSAKLAAFLAPSKIAVVGTISLSGMPQLTPNWYV